MMTLATRLDSVMTEDGWSNYRLADKAGLGEKTIRELRDGKTQSGRSSTISKIADALGVNRDWLESGQGPRRRGDIMTDRERRILEAYRKTAAGERPMWDRLADTVLEHESDPEPSGKKKAG